MSAVLHWLASQCSLLREYADFYTAFGWQKVGSARKWFWRGWWMN